LITDRQKIPLVVTPRIFNLSVASALIFLPVCTCAATNVADPVYSCITITHESERLRCYDNFFGIPGDEAAVLKNESQTDEQADEPVEPVTTSIVSERLKKEEVTNYNQFSITPHKPNYILPLTYNNNPNSELYNNLVPDDKLAENLDKYELKFQLSLKIPLVRDFVFEDSSLWFGYSQVAFWQMYNFKISAPFRETNYEPELIWVNKTNFKFFGFNNSLITLALNHQSNGRAKPLSRSWNRVVANFIFEKNNTILSFRPWYRIPEDKEDDGNPDIEKYLGYAEFGALYKYKEHISTLMLRNNMRSTNKTTAELTYTFRFSDRFKGIAQYFNGYGESLIDYNHRVQRLGVGILVTDWL